MSKILKYVWLKAFATWSLIHVKSTCHVMPGTKKELVWLTVVNLKSSSTVIANPETLQLQEPYS